MLWGMPWCYDDPDTAEQLMWILLKWCVWRDNNGDYVKEWITPCFPNGHGEFARTTRLGFNRQKVCTHKLNKVCNLSNLCYCTG